MSGTDGFDSVVFEKVDGLGLFGPIKLDVGLTAEAMGGGRLELNLEGRNKRTSNKK